MTFDQNTNLDELIETYQETKVMFDAALKKLSKIKEEIANAKKANLVIPNLAERNNDLVVLYENTTLTYKEIGFLFDLHQDTVAKIVSDVRFERSLRMFEKENPGVDYWSLARKDKRNCKHSFKVKSGLKNDVVCTVCQRKKPKEDVLYIYERYSLGELNVKR
jgi:hypothetical protein